MDLAWSLSAGPYWSNSKYRYSVRDTIRIDGYGHFGEKSAEHQGPATMEKTAEHFASNLQIMMLWIGWASTGQESEAPQGTGAQLTAVKK